VISRWWWGPKTGGEIWPKDRWIRSFDGTKICYTVLGPQNAPVVTFCAGFLCPDTYWRHIVPPLAEKYRVIVWNYRGIGASELPRNPGFHAYAIADDDLGIEANARDLWVILEKESIERTVLVGHSMGCQVALESYRQFPERIAAMALIAGPYNTPFRTFYGTDLSGRLLPVALPLLHLLPRVTLLAWRLMLHNPASFPIGQKVLRAIGPKAKAEDMRGYFDHVSMTDPLIAAKMVRAMHEHTAEDVLERIEVPVLIVHGTADPFTPLQIANEMAERIPDAKLVPIEGGAHTLPIEYPDEITTELVPFVESVLTTA
jgi:pimeloyl-ACP methyl ester carboxylesterase